MGSWTELRWGPLTILFAFSVGCTAPPLTSPPPAAQAQQTPLSRLSTSARSNIQTVSFAPDQAAIEGPAGKQATPEVLPTPSPASATRECEGDLTGVSELSVEALVAEVLTRNPSLAQMTAAWQAASARYPQAIALDDPMLDATIGPATYGANSVNGAYRLQISQKYYWPGKRRLRGERAMADAGAAGDDVEDTRLQLAEAARLAFYDYYLVFRGLAVNTEGIHLLEEFRKNAQTRYKTGLVPQQDVLQADVELGRQQEQRLDLEQKRQVAIARINTLMNLSPDAPLPPPPETVQVSDGLPEAAALRAQALSNRPDLQATRNRIAADQAALALANKEFYPDFTPFAMYDRFMGNQPSSEPLAYMIGMSVNLPVRRDKRFAAVAEAQARLNERMAELDKQINQVNFDVQQAYAQVTQGFQAVRLYEKTVLPAAEANVKAAQSAYQTGKIPFLSLIEAERNLIGLRDRYYGLVAEYYRKRATLERAIGGLDGDPTKMRGYPTPCR